MSEQRPYQQRVFQPPPGESSVPAFLKGDNGPVYRAAGGGGGGVDMMYPRSPAPLQFGASKPSSNNNNSSSSSSSNNSATVQWQALSTAGDTLGPLGLGPSALSSKQKSLEPSLGGYRAVPVGLQEGMQNLALSSSTPKGAAPLPTPLPAPTTAPVPVPMPMPVAFDIDHSSDEEEPLDANYPHSIMLTCPDMDTTDLLRQVAQVFDRAIDCEMDFKLRRIRGVVYEKYERCHFFVQHHASGSSGSGFRHALVFARRSGSHELFVKVVDATRQGLGKAAFCSEVTPAVAGEAGNGASAGAGAGAGTVSGGAAVGAWEEEEVDMDQATCEMLVGMCASEFADVAKEALATLAALVGSSRACQQLQEHSGGALVKALEQAAGGSEGKDVEVQWLCAYITAHLCAVPAFCAEAVGLLPVLFAQLNCGPDLGRRGSRRQAARALELVTRAETEAVLRQACRSMSILESLFHDPDPVLRASIRIIVEQLTA